MFFLRQCLGEGKEEEEEEEVSDVEVRMEGKKKIEKRRTKKEIGK